MRDLSPSSINKEIKKLERGLDQDLHGALYECSGEHLFRMFCVGVLDADKKSSLDVSEDSLSSAGSSALAASASSSSSSSEPFAKSIAVRGGTLIARAGKLASHTIPA